MCKVCKCICDNCLACRADKTKRPGHKMWDPVQKKLVEDSGSILMNEAGPFSSGGTHI